MIYVREERLNKHPLSNCHCVASSSFGLVRLKFNLLEFSQEVLSDGVQGVLDDIKVSNDPLGHVPQFIQVLLREMTGFGWHSAQVLDCLPNRESHLS